MRLFAAWTLLAVAGIAAIPGAELSKLDDLAFGWFSAPHPRIVEDSIPDPFRGGAYELLSSGALLHDWVEIDYRPKGGLSDHVLTIRWRDVFTSDVKLSPTSRGLAIEINKSLPPRKVFISTEELQTLGGREGPLLLLDGERRGRLPAHAWSWWEMIDSLCLFVIALILFALPKRRTPAPQTHSR